MKNCKDCLLDPISQIRTLINNTKYDINGNKDMNIIKNGNQKN